MSTDPQKYSTENQLDTIRRYAEQRGFETIRVFEDSGRSGGRYIALADVRFEAHY
jgi:DNA invertase Pin-like site-specific DNA recombinase